MIYVYTLVPFLIFYTIAVIQTKRSLDRWLLLWQWLDGIWKSLFAILPGLGERNSGDGVFMELSKEQVKEGLSRACYLMEIDGITYPEAYIKRAYDCENFAQAMKHHFDRYIATYHGIERRGIPTSVVGYTMEDGRGHAVLQITVEGQHKWYQPYPKHFKEMELSLNEIKSLHPVTIG